jgi:hypothetical protein
MNIAEFLGHDFASFGRNQPVFAMPTPIIDSRETKSGERWAIDAKQ